MTNTSLQKNGPSLSLYASIGNLMEASRDRWSEIMYSLAPSLIDAISKHPNHVPCPLHGGTDGFRLFGDFESSGGGYSNHYGGFSNGFKLLAWLRRGGLEGGVPSGYSWNTPKPSDTIKKLRQEDMLFAYKTVADYLEHGVSVNPGILDRIPRCDPKDKKEDIERKWKFALKIGEDIWSRGETYHPILAQYMRDRGQIEASLPQVLMLCTKVPYSGIMNSYHPAMVAPLMRLVPDEENPGEYRDEVVGIHRTYLRVEDNGKVAKAFVPKTKRELMWNTRKHAFIPLYPRDGDTLVVCEGIETGIALHSLTGLPVWAAGNARELGRMFIPPGIKHVLIAGDHDKSGTGAIAAHDLKTKLEAEGISCTVLIPSSFPIAEGSKSVDWEDASINYKEQTEALWAPFIQVMAPDEGSISK